MYQYVKTIKSDKFRYYKFNGTKIIRPLSIEIIVKAFLRTSLLILWFNRGLYMCWNKAAWIIHRLNTSPIEHRWHVSMVYKISGLFVTNDIVIVRHGHIVNCVPNCKRMGPPLQEFRSHLGMTSLNNVRLAWEVSDQTLYCDYKCGSQRSKGQPDKRMDTAPAMENAKLWGYLPYVWYELDTSDHGCDVQVCCSQCGSRIGWSVRTQNGV